MARKATESMYPRRRNEKRLQARKSRQGCKIVVQMLLVSLSFASGFTVPVAPNHAVGSVRNFLQNARNPTGDATCPPAGQLYLHT